MSATVKELLKSDSICKSYAQVKKGSSFFDYKLWLYCEARLDRLNFQRPEKYATPFSESRIKVIGDGTIQLAISLSISGL